ncbi:MAG: undecaprenyl-diphosphate phosphatase, partial [Solirubrobacteraceae bacterium]
MAPASDRRERLRLRDAVVLGLLHGPAELLPISSSGHVALAPWLLRWPCSELDGELRKSFEVTLHAGTSSALLFAGRDEVAATAGALDQLRARFLAASLVPPALAGL